MLLAGKANDLISMPNSFPTAKTSVNQPFFEECCKNVIDYFLDYVFTFQKRNRLAGCLTLRHRIVITEAMDIGASAELGTGFKIRHPIVITEAITQWLLADESLRFQNPGSVPLTR